ncbi:SDR family oxidoreductase [Candidatus Contendibacter odensensis]|uniref:NADP-dependent L-serine/L-allo-threonine dehydrogenase ydfG n=1 Tax=Candidatus Contendobacter odensis Run_B_J11 TaxID=1400861 RepID=A0A7U7GA42_9GAMM|nr:SDR family oxidoreductase [Candidatus Contendobacter odensis]CDH43971.1 NADP-dependent L-serine/L-allo-threonine dehydrogenase ydfG [Candidatus Contendobacter odensis Run_B_J11]
MSQIALITGATSGFGAACARRFAAHGWTLILCGRRQDRLDALRTELAATVPVHAFPLDVRDETAVNAAIAALPIEFAEVDLLVNNAGLALGLEPAQRCDMEDWQRMIDTNIKGLLYCTRAILPGMVARQRGHIINIGSVAGSYPYPGGNVYGATKAFVKQFSLNLRADLLGTRVRVTNVEPGLAESEFSLVRFKGDRDKADQTYQGTQPLRPEDIADIVYWAATCPAHININRIEVMPVGQAFAPFAISRDG